MNIYAIVLNEPNGEAWRKIREKWPNRHYILTDRIAFVAPGDITVTESVGDEIGMNDEQGVLGLVIEVDNYHGYNNSALWEWLGKLEKRQ